MRLDNPQPRYSTYSKGVSIIEIFKDIYIDNVKTHYMISNYGHILNTSSNKFLKPSSDKKGYLTVKLYLPNKKKTMKVHTLVANAFMPVHYTFENQVNHEDGDKHNNYLSNLEWITGSGNVKHAFDNKLKEPKFGSEHPNVVFNESIVHDICKLLEKGFTGKQIKQKLNIENKYLISNIKRRKYWTHISNKYNF